MSMIKRSNFQGAVLAALLALGSNFTAYANSYTMVLKVPYAPGSSPTYAFTGPLYATFTDVAGGVLLTLNASAMSSADYVNAWDFNITAAASGLLGHLTFTKQGSSLTPSGVGESPSSTLYTDDNGKYLFDMQMQFSGGGFTGGKTETYLITKSGGSGTLLASDFDQLSTTQSPYTQLAPLPPYTETQAFDTSADLLKTGGGGYNWLGGDVPDGGMTVILLGMGMLSLGAVRRFLKN
jgi:hypothetical protein